MAKTIIKLERKGSAQVRKKIKFYYVEKYFNKWMGKYDVPELNYQQKHYIMKKFWADGTICGFSVKTADKALAGLIENGSVDMGSNEVIFTPWVFANRYNIYDFPTHAMPINTRGVKFIPDEALEVDKEIALGWALKNHKSVFSSIEAKIDEIVDAHMKMRCALKAQSQAWMFTFDSEDRENAKVLQEQLENDNPYLFAPLNNPDKFKGVTSGAPYIIDKLKQYIDTIEDEILTQLGVNNIGVGEKKEHLIVDEVNANNQEIETQATMLENEIEGFFDRLGKVVGKKYNVIDLNEVARQEADESASNSNEEDEDDAQND